MRKHVSDYSILAMEIALIFYSATRTVDLIQRTLPADQQLTAYFALAAVDLGLIFWTEAFLHGAESFQQKAIAAIGTLIDFLGLGAATITDTQFESARNGIIAKPSEDTLSLVITVVAIVVVVNIGLIVYYRSQSPVLLEKAARDKIKAQIKRDALAKVEQDTPVASQQLATVISSSILNQAIAEQLSSLPQGYGYVQVPNMPLGQNVIQPMQQQQAQYQQPPAAPQYQQPTQQPVQQPIQQPPAPPLPKPKLFNFKVNLNRNGGNNADTSAAADSGTPPPIDPN